MKRKTQFIIGAGALVLTLAVVFALSNYPPTDDTVTGTMGAAEGIAGVEQAQRYRAAQVSDADVSLQNPEIQMLLQNDEVLDLLQDPDFQAAIQDPGLQHVMASDLLVHERLQRPWQ